MPRYMRLSPGKPTDRAMSEVRNRNQNRGDDDSDEDISVASQYEEAFDPKRFDQENSESEEEDQRSRLVSNQRSSSSSRKDKHGKKKRRSSHNPGARAGVLSESSQENRHNRRISDAHSEMGGTAKKQTKKPGTSGTGKASSNKSKAAAMEKLMKELEESKKKNEEQEAKIQALSAKKSKKQVLGKLPVSTEIGEKIRDTAGMLGPKLWRNCKFINNSDQEKAACKIVMSTVHEMKPLLECDDQTKVDDNVDAFVATYGKIVCTAINEARNNAQSGMKAAFLEFAAENKNFYMPTPKELITVLQRKKEDLLFPPDSKKPKAPAQEDFDNGEDDEEFKTQLADWETAMGLWNTNIARINRNRTIFQWYWTKLLSCVAGSKRWSKNIRCYGRISTHAFPDNPDLKCITTSDEALVALLYENCGQRWPYLVSQAKGSATYRVTKEDRKHELYQSAYSDSRSGQKKYGGWYEEGRLRFQHLEKKLRVAKKKAHVKDVEKEILVQIQKVEKIGKGKKKKRERTLDAHEERNDWRPVGVESDALTETEGEEESDGEFFEVTYGQQKPKKKARKDDSDENDE